MMNERNFVQPQHASFESRTPETRLVQNSGLKIGNKREPMKEQEDITRQFNQRVDRVQEHHEGTMSRAILLGKKFKEVMGDKTLAENKGPLQKSMTTEILREWQAFIEEMNNPPIEDVTTPEGAGSLAGILMIFSSLITLRDRANYNEYQVEQLSQELEKAHAQIKSLNIQVRNLAGQVEDLNSSSDE